MRRAAALVALLAAAGASAHWPSADDVLAEIGGPEGRAAGVVEVRRDAAVARVLLVRVGSRWHALSAGRRLELADAWREHWRRAVPGGEVGVLDAATGRPAVNYDGRGRARLAPPAPPPGTAATPP
ncbi:MAG TPA: hypothetical protein VNO26_09050 [Candidatus Limnocylindria bacterium]|nr:hypothetical protein [Candidatus Limnocylindria bacterium]